MFKRSCKLIAAVALAAALPMSWAADAPAPAPARAASAPPAAATTPAPAGAPAAAAAPVSAASASAVAGPTAAASVPAMVSAALTPGAPASAPVAGTLDGRIQDAKADVIKLNRDLLVLEEELLFPANTQVALFVSMDVGKMFQLDSVQVKLDDKVVANYLYTALEVEALHRGGVQRVYLGNLKNGQHELVAFFTGKGPHERDYRRGANVKFEKTGEAKYIELRIQDSTGKLQPEFDVKLWQ
ncbi:MAG TPA: AraC family transcriptional regulator [Caldimonas sp.]|nr:AraC family transcriptional regulator [Caldimonas sp.]